MEVDEHAGVDAKRRPNFFLRRDWLAFAVSFALAFALYVYTVAPSVTLEDSGEMAVAADYLGVPHPPGYPLWTIFSWVFTEILGFARFRGQPNPAWCVGVMSAFFGALTAGLAAMLISRTGRKHLIDDGPDDAGRKVSWTPTLAGISAGLLMAFAPVPWSQSVIVEVYTMNAFLVVLQLALAAMWLERPTNKLLFLLAFLFGVALTHYFYASAVNIMILVTIIWIKDRALFWEGTAGALLLIGLSRYVKAFRETTDGVVHHFSAFAGWFIRKTGDLAPDQLDMLQRKYLLTLSALICVVVVIVVVAAVRMYVPGRDRTRSLAIQAAAVFFGFLFAWCFLARSYRIGSPLAPQFIDQKSAETLSGAVIILLPIAAWTIQSIFLPNMKRRVVAAVIPPLLLVCMLLANSRWITAVTIAHRVPANVSVVEALDIVPRAQSLWHAALLVSVSALIWTLRGKVLAEWKRLLIMGLLVAGSWACIHLYLPWSSDRNPPMNWGYPRTWEGFIHAVFRGQYQKIEPSDPLSTEGFQQTLLYCRLLFRQFTVPIALFGLLPFGCWAVNFGRKKLRGTTIMLGAILVLTVAYVPAQLLKNFRGATPPAGIVALYGGLITLIANCALLGLLAIMLRAPLRRLLSPRLKSGRILGVACIAVVLTALVMTLASVSGADIRASFQLQNVARASVSAAYSTETKTHFVSFLHLAVLLAGLAGLIACATMLLAALFRWAWRLKCDETQKTYVLLSIVPALLLICLATLVIPVSPNSLFDFLKTPGSIAHLFGEWVSSGDGIQTFVLGTLPTLLIYAALVLYALCALLVALRPEQKDKAPDSEPALSCEWTISEPFRAWLLVIFWTFFFWGFVFACLANIKLDTQDIFIQRVKFLASYTVFSLYLGYGFIIVVNRVLPRFAPARPGTLPAAGLCLMLCLPVVPILNNAYNHALVTAVGAAEQTGHDFGWQFGNYELRGADAILEEIVPDEEPPPNPIYPAEMTPNAIFFGGTDPGRFVPTYMIYSADVRSDVYLITQNALADNTYMNVMRDLYGDRIWIPAQPDSALAFQRYVDEVRAGKRPKNADLQIRDGRVQISGALGVMEINGILAEMIFERNNWKHDFYVEESYVIRWMYPYSSPHGLIMKINSRPTQLSAENTRDDLDFWDWYVRRLLQDPKFDRDVVAKKSFSKLRSAIAGLYSYYGRLPEAEYAFHQARLLYPLSPEANFRLAQEVHLRQGRFAETVEMLEDFKSRDPMSDKTDAFVRQVQQMQEVSDQITALEQHRKDGRIDVNIALQLAELYLRVNRIQDFQTIMNDVLRVQQFPMEVYLKVAALALKVQHMPTLTKAMELCEKQVTPETKPALLLNIATLYAQANILGPAEHAMAGYLTSTPSDWKAWLDLGTMQISLRRPDDAVRSLQQAVNYGGRDALAIINRDQHFAPFRAALRAAVRQPESLFEIPGLPVAPQSTGTHTP